MFRARALLIPALVLVAANACTCDSTVTRESHGMLQMAPKGIDFGTGCLNETIERQFVLTNIGNTELEIFDVRQTGGDAFTILEDVPQFLEPGEAFVVRVGLTPEAAKDYTGTVTIETDDDENPVQSVTLVGKGFEGEKYDLRVSCEHEAGSGIFNVEECLSLTFNNVLVNTTSERKFLVENRGCGVIRVDELAFYADPNGDGDEDEVRLYSTPDAAAPFELYGLSKREVTVSYSPKEPGQPWVRLRLKSTDPAQKKPLWEPGEWDLAMFGNSVAPALLVEPDTLTFFEAIAGTPLTKTLLVRNTGDATLTVDSLSISGSSDFSVGAAGFTLAATGSAGDEREVDVTYTSKGPGSAQATLTVTAGQDAQKVALLGGTQPRLDVRWVDPSTQTETAGRIDFGTTVTGAKNLERTVRMFNEGQAPLTVTTVEIVDNAGGGFKLASTPTGAIAAGASAEFKIVFDDNVTVTNDVATLSIASDDPVSLLNGGVFTVDIVSKNTPNYAPIPIVSVCAKVNETATNCSSRGVVGGVLELSASLSTGPEAGDTLTYEWVLVKKPASSTARLDTPNGISTRIISDDGAVLDVAGAYGVRLVVTDQFGSASEASQAINAG